MKSIFVILFGFILVGTSFAEVNINGLSDEDISQLKIQAEQMRLNKSPISPNKAKEYVEIGKMIGEAFASCAKEVGVAVNDFVKTPVGKLTAGLIVYKLVGRDIMHFIIGIGFLCVMIPLYIYLLRRMKLCPTIEYGSGWWIFRSKKITYKNSLDGEDTFFWMAVLLIIIVVSQFIMWS